MKIRLWKLGNMEHKVYPTDAAVAKLSEFLKESKGKEIFDIIWGSDVTVQEFEVDEDSLDFIVAYKNDGEIVKVKM